MSEADYAPAIRVENLTITLDGGEPVVEDVSFDVAPGEILGVVGESGSGKTTLALALLGYARPGVQIRDGSIQIGGETILGRDARALRSLRGKVVAYVPQDPGGALNPSMRIGDAIEWLQKAQRANPLLPGPRAWLAAASALARLTLVGEASGPHVDFTER